MEPLIGVGPDGVVHEFHWDMATGLYGSNCGIRPKHDMGRYNVVIDEPVSCLMCIVELPLEWKGPWRP